VGGVVVRWELRVARDGTVTVMQREEVAREVGRFFGLA
jgi:hypothetical protein